MSYHHPSWPRRHFVGGIVLGVPLLILWLVLKACGLTPKPLPEKKKKIPTNHPM